MLDKGANPFVQNFDDKTDYDIWSFSRSNLTNVPKEKSIFFPIVNFDNKSLLGPWQYLTGVFPGKFNRLIGAGGEGYVVEGVWKNEKAAFKFVSVGKQKHHDMVDDSLVDMEKELSEMRTMQTTIGTSIIPIIGHFR